MENKSVQVGIGVFVFKDGKFLVQQRKGSHGAGSWAPPGGHLEFGESFEETAAREVHEETGLIIANIAIGAITNDIFADEGKHYATIWMTSDWQSGEPEIKEEDKCLEQRWVDFDNLPEPMFLPWQNLVRTEFFEKIKQQAQK